LLVCLFVCGALCVYPGYKVAQLNQVAYGYQGTLSLNGYVFSMLRREGGTDVEMRGSERESEGMRRVYINIIILCRPGPYGSDISTLALEVFYQTEDMLRIKIYDPNNAR
jgi:hypothetical protein